MKILKIIPFYLLLLYPILGYFSINYIGIPPYYVLSVFVIFGIISLLDTKIKFPKYLIFMFLYLIFVIFSKYIANKNPIRIDTNLGQVIYILLPLLLLIIVENTAFSPKFIRNSLNLLKLLILSAVITSIIQYFEPKFFLYDEIYTDYDPNVAGYARRIVSIFSWGDFNASRYITIGLVSMYGIVLFDVDQNKALSMLLFLFVGLIVLLSQFRIAILTFLLTTIAVFLVKRNYSSLLYLVLPLLVFYLTIVLLNYNVDYFIENRLKSDSALSRIEAFRAFFYAFPENPFFGTGGERTKALFEGFGRQAQLHNAHLATAYYYGIFASISHSLFLIYLSIRTFKTGRAINYWPPFIGIMCFIVATMTFPSGHFLEPGLIMLMVFEKYHKDIFKYNYNIQRNNFAKIYGQRLS